MVYVSIVDIGLTERRGESMEYLIQALNDSTSKLDTLPRCKTQIVRTEKKPIGLSELAICQPLLPSQGALDYLSTDGSPAPRLSVQAQPACPAPNPSTPP